MIECKQVIDVICDVCGAKKQISTHICYGDDQPKIKEMIKAENWRIIEFDNIATVVCSEHKTEYYSGYMIDEKKL